MALAVCGRSGVHEQNSNFSLWCSRFSPQTQIWPCARERIRLEFSIIHAIELFVLNSAVKIQRERERREVGRESAKRNYAKMKYQKKRAALISIQRTLIERWMEYLRKANIHSSVRSRSRCLVLWTMRQSPPPPPLLLFLRLCHHGGNWKTARHNKWNVYAWEPVNGSLRVQFKK